jgi:hypothetical protein
MTEEELKKEFRGWYFLLKPKKSDAFDAYINGKTAEWPAGIKFDNGHLPAKILAELDGPLHVLALRMLAALAVSMRISDAIEHKSGIRALAAGGVPFEKINRACARSAATEHWCSGYEAGRYCDDAAAAFVDLNLKKIAEGKAKPLSSDRYDFFIAMALGLLEKDPKKYARYIPAIENFAKLVFGDPRGARGVVLGQRSNLEQLRTACFAFVKGAGLLSPDLQEIERRVMMDESNLEVMWHDGIAGPMMTQEQVREKAGRIKQPAHSRLLSR